MCPSAETRGTGAAQQVTGRDPGRCQTLSPEWRKPGDYRARGLLVLSLIDVVEDVQHSIWLVPVAVDPGNDRFAVVYSAGARAGYL
jgi:hypothetical protein